jgi:predicted histone-like DNA-binding protein
MSLNFKPGQRIDPSRPTAPPRYYPVQVYRGKMPLRKIAQEVAERTSLSSTDVIAVIDALANSVPFFLGEGMIVDLGDFGSFRTMIRGTGEESAHQVSAKNITKLNLIFRPGNEFEEQLRKIEKEKI